MIPVGGVLSGSVVDWAANWPIRRSVELKARVGSENDFIFFSLKDILSVTR